MLNHLSNKMIKKFDALNIPYNEAFIGVLFSGDMTITGGSGYYTHTLFLKITFISVPIPTSDSIYIVPS